MINKRILIVFILAVSILFSNSLSVYSAGDGNVDGGGGGFGSALDGCYWNTGNEGVRVSVIRVSDNMTIKTPIDYTNIVVPTNIQYFDKKNKIQYKNNGYSLNLYANAYVSKRPEMSLPRIIKRSADDSTIDEIKRYFCSEGALKMIANDMGMSYSTMINGDYKLLIEPVAYFTFMGDNYAMTATEAAIYNKMLASVGADKMSSKMPSLTHQNLPLSMFLEQGDLGFQRWTGSTTVRASDDDIMNYLGIGVVSFSSTNIDLTGRDYTYNTGSWVISSVILSSDQKITPDNPASVSFDIMGTTYTVDGLVLPAGGSEPVWVKWKTPSTPQQIVINVQTSLGGVSKTQIVCDIVNVTENTPPDPQADDRRDGYSVPSSPSLTVNMRHSWHQYWAWWKYNWTWISDWVWIDDGYYDGEEWIENGYWEDWGGWEDNGWWVYETKEYSASLSSLMTLSPNPRSPTATDYQMKSGYGVVIDVMAVSIKGGAASGDDVTSPQTVMCVFPEFDYKTYNRLLQPSFGNHFEFKPNKYSTYNDKTHFTPIWFPDYTYYEVYAHVSNCWTPMGELSILVSDSVYILGNLWDDWYVRPFKK